MIDALSPLSRKIIAVALLLLALVTMLNLVVVPLWQSCADALDELAAARLRLAHIQGIARAPIPEPGDVVPATAMIVSTNHDGAVATLVGAISASAAKAKITPQLLTPVARAGGAVAGLAVDIEASGSEADLVVFLADIESTSPAVRLQSWSLSAPLVPDGPTHLRARAVALWSLQS